MDIRMSKQGYIRDRRLGQAVGGPLTVHRTVRESPLAVEGSRSLLLSSAFLSHGENQDCNPISPIEMLK